MTQVIADAPVARPRFRFRLLIAAVALVAWTLITVFDPLRAGRAATIVGSLIAFQMSVVLMRGFWDPNAEAPKQAANNTGALGKLLYTEYLYPFEVAALILLVAMVAAIALTLRKRKDTKSQNPSEQVRVKAADRVKLVSMPADLDRKQTKSGQ